MDNMTTDKTPQSECSCTCHAQSKPRRRGETYQVTCEHCDKTPQANCRGSKVLGNACGRCPKCRAEDADQEQANSKPHEIGGFNETLAKILAMRGKSVLGKQPMLSSDESKLVIDFCESLVTENKFLKASANYKMIQELVAENERYRRALEKIAAKDNDTSIEDEPSGGTYDDYMSWGCELADSGNAKIAKKALTPEPNEPSTPTSL